MFGLSGAWAFLTAHPLIGFAVFVAVGLGIILVFSGGKLGDTLAAMLRVAWTVLSTPFVFLRDAVTLIRTSGESEQDYAGSTVFMLFRGNRILYLLLMLGCILLLSSGVTSSLLSLYPQAEIERGQQLTAEIARLETELEGANQEAATAGSPQHAETLQTQATEARNAYRQQVQSNAAFFQSSAYSNNQLLLQLANTGSASSVNQVRENVDRYLSDCPRGYYWRGLTPADCIQLRAVIVELANRRDTEFRLAREANDAESAWRQADNAAQAAATRVQEVEAQLRYAREQREAVSLFNPDMVKARISAAIATLIGTLMSVVILVWVASTAIDLANWTILMMRAAERDAQSKLQDARSLSVD